MLLGFNTPHNDLSLMMQETGTICLTDEPEDEETGSSLELYIRMIAKMHFI
jgi:hypothetical protein